MLSSYLHGQRHQIFGDDRLYKKIGSNLCRSYWIRIGLLYGSMWVLWLLRWFLDGRRRRLRWRAQVHCGKSQLSAPVSRNRVASLQKLVRPAMAPDSRMIAILAPCRCECYSSRTGQISTPFFVGSIRSRGGLIKYVRSASIVIQQ